MIEAGNISCLFLSKLISDVLRQSWNAPLILLFIFFYFCIFLFIVDGFQMYNLGWTRVERDRMGIPIVKTNYFSQLVSGVIVLKGYVEFVIYKCCRIFDVILRLTSVILDHIQKRKIMAVNGKSAWNGFNLGLGSDQVALKSQVLLSRNFLAILVFLLMSQLMLCECFLVVLW